MESFIPSSIQGLGAAQLSARTGCGCMEMINASRAVHADLSGSKPKRGGRQGKPTLSRLHTAPGIIVIINCSADKINNCPPVLPPRCLPSSSPLKLGQDVGSGPLLAVCLQPAWLR